MAAAAQPVQILEQAIRQNDLTKLPVFHGETTKDAFRPEDWWARFEAVALGAQWDWAQIRNYFMQALRGDALEWWNTVTKQATIENIDNLRHYFLTDFASTATSRTTAAHIKIKQDKGMSVRKYMSKIQTAFTNLELTVEPLPVPQNVAECLPNRPQGVAAADINGLPLAWLREVVAHHRREGFKQFYEPTLRSIFIDGLLPHLKVEVIRINPRTARTALEAAHKFEKEYEDKVMADALVGQIQLNPLQELPPQGDIHYIQRGRGSYRGGRGSYRGRGGPTRNTVPKDAKCHYCQKPGHYQKECYSRLRANAPMKSQSRQFVKELEEQPPNRPDSPDEYISIGSLQRMNNHLNW
jgi:Retrotransposon gag protein